MFKRITVASIIMLMVLAAAIITALMGDVAKPQKFIVTYEIRYNEQTLEQATATEKRIRKEFGDACDITVTLQDTQDAGIFIYNSAQDNFFGSEPVWRNVIVDSTIWEE